MTKTWVYSDPHFYHKNICNFTNFDGTPLRPWDDVNIMTEEMIQWYNECVNDQDRVYILGDVAFTAAKIKNSVGRMKGRKCLILGNHDPVKIKKYIDVLDDVRGYVQRQGFIMSHIPIHEGSLGRWKLNIHGHLHANTVRRSVWDAPVMDKSHPSYDDLTETVDDERYYCACVERTSFRPIELQQILEERKLS